MANVIAATTNHVQGLIAQGNTTPQTPAQYATAAGYPGSKASALRRHIARQHGQGAYSTGHGRYPAMPPKAMLALLQGGHVASKPAATAKQRQQASALAKRTLWQRKQATAAKRGAGQAKGKAQATPVPAAPTAQASTAGQGS